MAELAPLLVGRRVLEVVGLPPRDLLFILAEDEERVRRLRVSAEQGAARIHLQIGRLARRDSAKAPFFQRAAELFDGGIVEGLEQVDGDRIVRLTVRPETGGERHALVAELFGRGANLCLLVGRKVDAICVVPKGTEARAKARLVLGEGYRPPTGAAPGSDASPTLEEALPAPPAEASKSALARIAPLSWRVEYHIGGAAERTFQSTLRKELSGRLTRKRKSTEKLLAGLHDRSEAVATAERVRQDGELLKAHLHELKRGMEKVVLSDWFTDDSPARELRLDPKLSPNDNAERYFARYKKHLRSLEHVPHEIELAEATLAGLSELIERAADPVNDPVELEEEAVRARLLLPRQDVPTRRKKPATRLPYKSFNGSNGGEIRVGRSAKDNDRLSLRESRGNDLWLHTRDTPGSHVVLRVPKGTEPNDEEVLDAAHLALHFSPLRGARRASIHVARCKELKKPKKAPPGLVTLSGGRTLELRVEEDRLARLLRGERRAKGSQTRNR